MVDGLNLCHHVYLKIFIYEEYMFWLLKRQLKVSLQLFICLLADFNDTGDYWRSWYEASTFESDVKTLYDELLPLYEQLHAYVRQKLKNKYGTALFPDTGHIPAHLLGNMWSQSWSNIYDLLTPYPNAISVDITKKMKDKVRKSFTRRIRLRIFSFFNYNLCHRNETSKSHLPKLNMSVTVHTK